MRRHRGCRSRPAATSLRRRRSIAVSQGSARPPNKTVDKADSLTDGTPARAGVESFLLAATESLPESTDVPPGCMAMLAAVSDEWPRAITDVANSIRSESLEILRSRLSAAVADGELPASTDVDRLSRFYLGVFQWMAIQAKDGATTAELKGIGETAMAAWPTAQRSAT
jgi:hypothetical protein